MIFSPTLRLIFITTEPFIEEPTHKAKWRHNIYSSSQPVSKFIASNFVFSAPSYLSQRPFNSIFIILFSIHRARCFRLRALTSKQLRQRSHTHQKKKKKKILPTSERHEDAGGITAAHMAFPLFDLSSSAPSRFRRRGELRPHGPLPCVVSTCSVEPPMSVQRSCSSTGTESTDPFCLTHYT